MKLIKIITLILMTGISYAQLMPDVYQITWNRSDPSTTFTTNVLLTQTTYILSNTIFAVNGTQNLTGIGCVFKVGDLNTNISYAGTVVDAVNGIVTATIKIPSPSPKSSLKYSSNIQLSLTNATYTVTYSGFKQVTITNPL